MFALQFNSLWCCFTKHLMYPGIMVGWLVGWLVFYITIHCNWVPATYTCVVQGIQQATCTVLYNYYVWLARCALYMQPCKYQVNFHIWKVIMTRHTTWVLQWKLIQSLMLCEKLVMHNYITKQIPEFSGTRSLLLHPNQIDPTSSKWMHDLLKFRAERLMGRAW